MSVFGHTQIKSNENVYTIQETDANIKKRMPAGTIIMYAGKSIPEGFLMCNGGAYSSSVYPELYAAIGTIYGNGEGGSNGEDFNVPDLTDAGDNGNLGRFIRAATTLDEVGTKEADAIRNITGSLYLTGGDNSLFWGSGTGAFKTKTKDNKNYFSAGKLSTTISMQSGWGFAASNVVNTDDEVRPYSMRVLYLIAY